MKKTLLALALFGSPMAFAAIQSAQVVSEPSGYGQRYDRIILRYDELFNSEHIPVKTAFRLNDLVVEKVSLGKCIDRRKICRSHEIVLHLDKSNPNDRFLKVTMQPKAKAPSVERQVQFQIEQIEPILSENKGKMQEVAMNKIETQTVQHNVVEPFEQREFVDENGVTIRYNLFVPKDSLAKKRYPLVLFLHDLEANNSNVKNTLWQGNGATTWAEPKWQKNYPAFVLAPQFEQSANNPETLSALHNLLAALQQEFAIDPERLYATAQWTGTPALIAMQNQYPNLFAASYLVAGQWENAQTAPIARNKIFMLISEDDHKGFPLHNQTLEQLALDGAVVQKAILSSASAEKREINREVRTLLEREGNIYSMGITSKTLPEKTHSWQMAYEIDEVKMWLFRQSKR